MEQQMQSGCYGAAGLGELVMFWIARHEVAVMECWLGEPVVGQYVRSSSFGTASLENQIWNDRSKQPLWSCRFGELVMFEIANCEVAVMELQV